MWKQQQHDQQHRHDGNQEQQAGFAAYDKKHGLKSNQEPTRAQQTELVNSVLAQAQIKAVKSLDAPSREQKLVSGLLEASSRPSTWSRRAPP
jgi:hypothetical protein